MKAIGSSMTRALPAGAKVLVADNSGARIVEVMSVMNYKGVKNRAPSATVGDLVNCAVKVGTPELKGTVVKAIVIRQKKPFRRLDGTRVKFNDNAVVLIKDVKEGLPSGTAIRGAVAREVIDRWPKVAKICSTVV